MKESNRTGQRLTSVLKKSYRESNWSKSLRQRKIKSNKFKVKWKKNENWEKDEKKMMNVVQIFIKRKEMKQVDDENDFWN